MPIYIYACSLCENKQEEFFSFDDRKEEVECSNCKGGAKYDFSATVLGSAVRGDELRPYYDENLGVKIESKSQRDRIHKERGLMDARDYSSKYCKNWGKKSKPIYFT